MSAFTNIGIIVSPKFGLLAQMAAHRNVTREARVRNPVPVTFILVGDELDI